jgi:hypothetical protein
VNKNKHADVPKKYGGGVGSWVNKQRLRYELTEKKGNQFLTTSLHKQYLMALLQLLLL